MRDTYQNFEALSQHERVGIDYAIELRAAPSRYASVAVHGGGIEPGTSEVADAIAADRHGYYAFEGLKLTGNAVLHITSTRFDEPRGLALASSVDTVIAVHGEGSGSANDAAVFLGGRDTCLGDRVRKSLVEHGFVVRTPEPDLRGLDCANICNRGRSGQGVQLELSFALRSQLFKSLDREGRKTKRERFYALVDAIASTLDTST